MGRPRNTEPQHTATFRMPTRLFDEATVVAFSQGADFSAYVRRLVSEDVARQKSDPSWPEKVRQRAEQLRLEAASHASRLDSL